MKIVLKGIHATANAGRLRAKMRTRADIVLCESGAPSELAPALAGADAVVAMQWEASAPGLKLLQLPGAGVDGIAFETLPAGCRVCNVFEHEIGISEYVMLAMLEWSVRLCALDAGFRDGDWTPSVILLGPTHGELAGKTLGIVGFGHIGRAVARRAKAFDMRILAITRRRPEDAGDADAVYLAADIDEALPVCDFVVLACPLTAETRGLIDGARLAAMKESAVLINVSRGSVVVEDDLYHALKEGRIGGAVLDVWYQYPKPGGESVRPSRHPFHELANVYMTPHASSWSEGLLERRWTVIADNMDRLADGRPLRNLVQPPDAAGDQGGS